MELLQKLDYQGKEIKVIEKEGRPYFVGRDIAEVLGYTNPLKAIRDHVKSKHKLTERFVQSGQSRDIIIISEPGLYNLIFRSKLEKAERFSDWVTEDVLPDIRKYGMYIDDEFARAIIDSPKEAREEMLKYFNESQRLQGILKEYREEIERLKQAEQDLIDAEKKLEFLQERPENSDWKKEANKRVRKLAPKITGFAKQNFGTAWNEVYREMYYSENINIKTRHKRRIQRMKDDSIEQGKVDNTTILDTIGTDVEYVDMLFRVIDKLEEKYEYKKEPTLPLKGNANERAKEFTRLLEAQDNDFLK